MVREYVGALAVLHGGIQKVCFLNINRFLHPPLTPICKVSKYYSPSSVHALKSSPPPKYLNLYITFELYIDVRTLFEETALPLYVSLHFSSAPPLFRTYALFECPLVEMFGRMLGVFDYGFTNSFFIAITD